jgi:exonuclease III
MIVAELSNPVIGTLTACSFHIPNGSDYQDIKREVGDEMANWLTKKRTRTVCGIDANSPEIDHPDTTKIKLYKYDSRLLLGRNPIHNLKDACRVYLNAHPEIMRPIEILREQGPLFTSFINYKHDENKTPVPHRYDHIYITPDIKVSSLKYLDIHAKVYDDSDKRLSDHAMVVTDLSMN